MKNLRTAAPITEQVFLNGDQIAEEQSTPTKGDSKKWIGITVALIALAIGVIFVITKK